MSDQNQSSERQMHPATCTECGSDTQVPFKPTQGKPITCRDCFIKRRNSSGERTMHKATCSSCDKECEVPFKPSGNKPILCKPCYIAKMNA